MTPGHDHGIFSRSYLMESYNRFQSNGITSPVIAARKEPAGAIKEPIQVPSAI
jgi:hypothetical protein